MTHMFTNDSGEHLVSNVLIYREIAVAAHKRMQDDLAVNIRGNVKTYDPEHKSFKDGMVAIVFAGMTIEATLWLKGCARLTVAVYQPLDKKPIEVRMEKIGINEKALLDDAKAFRLMRAELVHEKSVPLTRAGRNYVCQGEAVKAIALMKRVEVALNIPHPDH